MLWFFRGNMFEFGKGSAYIVYNCHVDKTFVVVPFEVQATIEVSSTADGALVLVFNGINKV